MDGWIHCTYIYISMSGRHSMDGWIDRSVLTPLPAGPSVSALPRRLCRVVVGWERVCAAACGRRKDGWIEGFTEVRRPSQQSGCVRACMHAKIPVPLLTASCSRRCRRRRPPGACWSEPFALCVVGGWGERKRYHERIGRWVMCVGVDADLASNRSAGGGADVWAARLHTQPA